MTFGYIERGPTCLFATEIEVIVCSDACGVFSVTVLAASSQLG